MSRETRSDGPGQAGFTLLELLVAMVATLIVTGAMYGLMVGGKSAFRREPELADRQQQIRIAMSLIERDVVMAGQDIGWWYQIFAPGLDSWGVGPAGDPLPTVVTPQQGGTDVDALEMRSNDGLCPPLSVCSGNNGIAGSNLRTLTTIPDCLNIPGLAVITNPATGLSTVIWACVSGSGETSSCAGGGSDGGGQNGHVNFQTGNAPPGCDPANPANGCNDGAGGNGRIQDVCEDGSGGLINTCIVSGMQIARYEIRVDAQGVPNLWRSPTGGLAQGSSGNCNPEGDANGFDDWQLVARGIEDMQVLYRTGNAGPLADGFRVQPEVVLQGQPNTIVREVRVTLSARSLAPNLQGQSNSAQGAAVRGQVTRTITPRMALVGLQNEAQWR